MDSLLKDFLWKSSINPIIFQETHNSIWCCDFCSDKLALIPFCPLGLTGHCVELVSYLPCTHSLGHPIRPFGLDLKSAGVNVVAPFNATLHDFNWWENFFFPKNKFDQSSFCATTFSITTHSIMTLSIKKFSITTLSIMPFIIIVNKMWHAA